MAHREAVRLELREIEDVPTRRSSRSVSAATMSSDASTCSGSETIPSRNASTWPRIAVNGVLSSCETDMRKERLSFSGTAGASVNSASGRAVMHWFTAHERGLALGVRQRRFRSED